MSFRAFVTSFAVSALVAVMAPSCGPTTCTPTSCPLGCCDRSGLCQPGNSTFACGARGNTCEACSTSQSCSSNACSSSFGFGAGAAGAGIASTGGGSTSSVGGGAAGGGMASSAGGTASTGGGSPSTGGGTAACSTSWILGQTAVRGSENFGTCNRLSFPTNCSGGYWIEFKDQSGTTTSCSCAIECSQIGKTVGQACDTNGVVICSRISNGGASSGNICVRPSWNLCGSTGTGSGGGSPTGGGPAAGGPAAGGSATCKATGVACARDAECCSTSCDTFNETCD